MKIAVLPLDSRPCTYDFVQQLAAIGGIDCLVPPLEIMDHFQQPGDHSAMKAWLFEACKGCDALVVSVEQWVYGGLITSRRSGVDSHTAMSRLNELAQLKLSYPKLSIYAANVLMRTTISTINQETKVWWEAVAQYSKYVHLAQMNPCKEYHEQLDALTSRIPKDILEEFLAVRRRNAGINLRCIELVRESVFGFLCVLQEDCTEFGLHKAEQEQLLCAIDRYGLQEQVLLHNGTDEAVPELLFHAAGTSLPIRISWLGSNPNFISLFEDRPFLQNVNSHLKTIGMVHDPNALTTLFVYLPEGAQQDFCTDAPEAPRSIYCDEALAAFANEIAEAVRAGRPCYLLDLAFANGGDYRLLAQLAKQIPLQSLYGYAAWNTSSNALGTILAQIAATAGENSKRNQVFTLERIFDDTIYQGTVRRAVVQELAKRNIDAWNIDNLDEARQVLADKFEEHAPTIETLFNPPPAFSAEFRWARTFELAITVKGVTEHER